MCLCVCVVYVVNVRSMYVLLSTIICLSVYKNEKINTHVYMRVYNYMRVCVHA